MRGYDDLPERIRSKVDPDGPGGCWPWLGYTNSDGYGEVWWQGGMAKAHRLTFHLLVDPSLPVYPGGTAGLVINHICRVPPCVRPDHLETMSNRGNTCAGECGVMGDHSSGALGVSWYKRHQCWRAQIKYGRRRCHLGYFTTEEAAAIRYDAARLLIDGMTPNHDAGLCPRPRPVELATVARRLGMPS